MKRRLAGVLSLALAVSLTACGGGTAKTPETAAKAAEAGADQGGQETKDAAGAEGKQADAAAAQSDKKPGDGGKLVVYSPNPLEFMDPLVALFQEQTGIEVELVAAGTGELLKRIEAEAANPLGDVLWSGTISTVKPKMEYFEEYVTVNDDMVVSDEYKNSEGALTRVALIPSILMVNTELAGDIKIEGYQDLLNPELKGKIAFCDPSQSSSAWEHLVNMLYAMGNGNPDDGWAYVEELCKNLDGKLLGSSSAVNKGVADGEYTVGLTFESGGTNYVIAGAPVEVRYMEEGTIFKPDGIYIIKGAKNLENAKKFLDFATSKEAQIIMQEECHSRTIRKDTPASTILKSYAEIKSIKDDEAVVNESKKAWLDKFKDIYTSVQ